VSTILKALRRVEEGRPAQPQRRSMRGDIVTGGGKPPVSGPGGKPPAPRRNKPRGPNLLIWSSLGAALLLAALVWWRLPGAEDADLVEAQPPAAAERSAPAPAAHAVRPPASDLPPRSPVERLADATEPAAAPAPPAPAAPETAPAIDPGLPDDLAQRLPPLGETLDAPVPELPAAVAPPSPPSEPAAQPAPSRSSAPAAPVARSEPRPPPPPQAAAPVVKPPRVAASAPAPKPPVAAKRAPAPPPPSAPAVQVERTSWHPKPGRRVAWVRLEGSSVVREVHEGDALGTLVVKEIRPSAVVFLHGAEQLQRRVGEH
jgi:hypothetical protein